MNAHRYDPTSKLCLGCSVAARDVASKVKPAECPGLYGRLGDGEAHYVLTTKGSLVLIPEKGFAGIALRFDPEETLAIRDAIDEGARELSDRARPPAAFREFGDDE